MVDPDDQMIECQNCGKEFYYNVRYHKYTRSARYCHECVEMIDDMKTDYHMQRIKDGEE